MSQDLAEYIAYEFIGVHRRHCCTKHGCQYGEHDECPIALEIFAPDEEEEECDTCWEDRANEEAEHRLIDSFQVSVVDGAEAVTLQFVDTSVEVEPHVAREWAQQLLIGAGKVKPIFTEQYGDEKPIIVEEWATLTYLVFPSGDIPGVWVGHCLEVDVVSQGTEETGPEGAFQSTLEATAITIELDRREGRDPFERQAPDEEWPPSRLAEWKKIRAELGAQATWKGHITPSTLSFEDAAKEKDDATE